MIQKGGKENDELSDDLKEDYTNPESVISTLDLSSVFLRCNGDKAPMHQSNNFLDTIDNDELWNCSDNANSLCSSDSSFASYLSRNVHLDDVEFSFEQIDKKCDLLIKGRLKTLKVKKISIDAEKFTDSNVICLDLIDFSNTNYTLIIKPLFLSLKSIDKIELKGNSCFEITCKKDLPMSWPCLIEMKNQMTNYRMDKFRASTHRSVTLDQESDNDDDEDLDKPIPLETEEDRQRHLYIENVRRSRLGQQFDEKWRMMLPFANNNNSSSNENKNEIGYTGLHNLGNTCFMNSCLQCLSNTIELRDYFLDNDFSSSINRSNPFGSNGSIAIGFYTIVKNLWSGKHASFSPENFKNFISAKMNKFEGNAQEDSVEFLELFLDLLHEDMNRVDRSKKILDDPLPKAEEAMTDLELAVAMWSRHLKYNDSLIVDLFHGQLKSQLVCTICKKKSITFDPFLFLPVPLPKPQITYTVFYFNLKFEKKPLKVSMTSNQDVKCVALLEMISKEFDVKVTNLCMLACDVQNEKLVEGDEQINQFENCDLFIFELKDEKECGEKVYNFHIKQCRMSMSKSYLEFETGDSKYWSSNDWRPDQNPPVPPPNCYNLGRPFIISLSASEMNYKNLYSVLKNRARHSVDINLFKIKYDDDDDDNDDDKVKSLNQLPASPSQAASEDMVDNNRDTKWESSEAPMLEDFFIEFKVSPFMVGNRQVRKVRKLESEMSLKNSFDIIEMSSKNQDWWSKVRIINEQTDLNELSGQSSDDSSEERIHKSSSSTFCLSSSRFRTLYMQWKDDPDSDYRLRINTKSLDHSATYFECMNQMHRNSITLNDCLTMFTDVEELSLEDCWNCPQCKKPQKASKHLTIWRLPKLLIIQLKRFSYKQFTRDKIGSFVEFPLYDLDLKEFCSETNQENLDGQTKYDLYGVINHFGGIYGGHYTAAAKTKFQNNEYQWRLFDDYSVENMDEGSIVTSNAYILFYRLSSTETKSRDLNDMETSMEEN